MTSDSIDEHEDILEGRDGTEMEVPHLHVRTVTNVTP
jgi:hypothetical protein